MNKASEIQDLAMKLPQRSRLKLAGDLLRSLDSETSPRDILDEAARRENELESGKTQELDESQFWAGVTRSHRKP
jgi:hypothetical protein